MGAYRDIEYDIEISDEKIRQLEAELEAARKEIAVLNRMIESVWIKINFLIMCPAKEIYNKCNKRGKLIDICKKCWLDYFRTEAEKGEG